MAIIRPGPWLALLWVGLAGGGLPTSPLRAQAPPPPTEAVSVRTGMSRIGFTFMDVGSGRASPAVEVTYFGSDRLLWELSPLSGLVASTRGAFYAYAGVQVAISLPLALTARPSVSAGFYEEGRGVDLGHFLEFRSALLVDRQITPRVHVSAVVFHLSNAGIGMRNPGTEAAGIGLSVVPDADAILSFLNPSD